MTMKTLVIFLSMLVSGCITPVQRKLERDVHLLKYRVKKLERIVDQLEGDVALLNAMPPEDFQIPMPEMTPLPKTKVAPKPAQLPKVPASPIKKP